MINDLELRAFGKLVRLGSHDGRLSAFHSGAAPRRCTSSWGTNIKSNLSIYRYMQRKNTNPKAKTENSTETIFRPGVIPADITVVKNPFAVPNKNTTGSPNADLSIDSKFRKLFDLSISSTIKSSDMYSAQTMVSGKSEQTYSSKNLVYPANSTYQTQPAKNNSNTVPDDTSPFDIKNMLNKKPTIFPFNGNEQSPNKQAMGPVPILVAPSSSPKTNKIPVVIVNANDKPKESNQKINPVDIKELISEVKKPAPKEVIPKEVIPEVKKPIAKVEVPISEIKKPILEVKEQVSEVKKPVLEVKEQVSEIKKPIVKVEVPIPEIKKPVLEVKEQVAEVKKPIAKVEVPVPEVKEPVPEVKEPIPEVKEPIAKVEIPIPEIKTPVLEVKESVTKVEVPFENPFSKASPQGLPIPEIKQIIPEETKESRWKKITEILQTVAVDVPIEMKKIIPETSDCQINGNSNVPKIGTPAYKFPKMGNLTMPNELRPTTEGPASARLPDHPSTKSDIKNSNTIVDRMEENTNTQVETKTNLNKEKAPLPAQPAQPSQPSPPSKTLSQSLQLPKTQQPQTTTTATKPVAPISKTLPISSSQPLLQVSSSKTAPKIVEEPAEVVVAEIATPELEESNKTDFTTTKLSIDDINISLKVVGDMKSGCKLRIVGDKHLAEENSYLPSITRYRAEQGRDKIINFLQHFLDEINRNVSEILGDIRNGKNVDTNVSILDNLIRNISIFVHNYEKMRSAYQSDSIAFSKLGNIKTKFYTFSATFFRDVTTYGTVTKSI
jgi:hypothetical protein